MTASGSAAETDDPLVVNVELRADQPVPDETINRLSATVRPADESLCLWRDPKDWSVVRLSLDVETTDEGEAIAAGCEVGGETAALSGGLLRITEVVACSEVGWYVWRPDP